MSQGEQTGLDYAALFAAVPVACVVLDRELVIVAVNETYLRVTGRGEQELLGRPFFDAYPPGEEAAESAAAQRRSLETVLATGLPDALVMHRFSIPRAGAHDAPDAGPTFEPRWWNILNAPVLDADGRVTQVIHRVDDVTEYFGTGVDVGADAAAGPGAPPENGGSFEPHAQLFTHARELQRLNQELREQAARTHGVALTLQKAMLSTPDLERHPEIAVRYRPADRDLNACGDWYDVVDLGGGCLALSVGDVVGHGVAAASVMGMLRAGFSAAVRIADGPSGALEALGLYARAHEAALATTTFACQLFSHSGVLTYSNAGHPPPLLLHADGRHEFLDGATDPPLGVRIEHVPRPQATVDFGPGDTLVLYTDGLIERRRESLGVGLERLVDIARPRVGLPPGRLADEILELIANPAGTQDDISLLVARL